MGDVSHLDNPQAGIKILQFGRALFGDRPGSGLSVIDSMGGEGPCPRLTLEEAAASPTQNQNRFSEASQSDHCGCRYGVEKNDRLYGTAQ